MTDYLRALVGGALIGLAATLALVIHGRITGICGILARVLERDGGRTFRVGFLTGLVGTGAVLSVVAPGLFGATSHGLPHLAFAGLLVGIGTTFANGCTAGHGVCGIARFSTRSFVAAASFIFAGMVTVALAGGHA